MFQRRTKQFFNKEVPKHRIVDYSLAAITFGYETIQGFSESHQPFTVFDRYKPECNDKVAEKIREDSKLKKMMTKKEVKRI